MNILHTAFIRLCRKNEERKKSHNDHLTNRLLTYIKGHFWESGLSLTALAGKRAPPKPMYLTSLRSKQA